MSEFTKGPWTLSETWRPPIGRGPHKNVNSEGNIFWGYSISGCNENGAHILPTLAAVHNFPEQMEANAHLIASSPDLYEALEEVVENYAVLVRELNVDEFTKSDREIIERGRAALSKARGE